MFGSFGVQNVIDFSSFCCMSWAFGVQCRMFRISEFRTPDVEKSFVFHG